MGLRTLQATGLTKRSDGTLAVEDLSFTDGVTGFLGPNRGRAGERPALRRAPPLREVVGVITNTRVTEKLITE
ncbi:hypothetical protein J7F01_41265 [Streptomyces sp. ISL-22]|uniref:hypothetical protein n=1 Tax=unclassified Streptomyces TaxID=2593676 RepID=UPI001BE97A5F|nr:MULTISPECIES: hypothetical protein [unclassified Streptomyces]MBT2423436.1 hypothetical protein [Streptomyces sp. ISL-24]MBT2438421.1 hypothetical protein [Streptomyces sp. ISL-22]